MIIVDEAVTSLDRYNAIGRIYGKDPKEVTVTRTYNNGPSMYIEYDPTTPTVIID
jgi:hypothetical protein